MKPGLSPWLWKRVNWSGRFTNLCKVCQIKSMSYSIPSSTKWILAALYLPASLFAQSLEDNQIVELVVTGTHLPIQSNRLSSIVTVISLDDLVFSGDAHVVDALRSVEGLHVTQPGGPGGVSSLFLRGAEANFTTVLVDGVKFNNSNNTRGGSFDFSTLAISDVERIEIVRGPQSAIYGSDALAGVVNIVSRAPMESGGRGAIAYGQKGFLHADFSGSVQVTDRAYFSGGLSSTEDSGSVSGSDYQTETAWATYRGAAGSSTRYQLNVRAARSTQASFPEDSGGPLLAVMQETDAEEFDDLSLSAKLTHAWNSHWESLFLVSHYQRDDLTDSPGVADGVRNGVPPNRFDSGLKRSRVQLANRYVKNGFAFSFGGDFQSEEGHSTGELEAFPGFLIPAAYKIQRDVLGLYVDAILTLSENLQLLVAVRQDDPDTLAAQISPSAGLIWASDNDRTVVRFNWAKGFKLPSFFALASPLVGNPSLNEERVTGTDLAVTQRIGDGVSVNITVFDSQYEDLVDFDSDAFINVNRSRVNIRGVESSLSWSLSNSTHLRAHATYTDIDVLPFGKLRQRPDFRAGFTLNHHHRDTVNFNLNLLHVEETFDSSVPTGDLTIDGYTRVDLATHWQLSKRLNLSLAIDNVLNEKYVEAIGFPAAGSMIRLGLGFRL